MLVAQGRRYAVEMCNTDNLNRMFVICAKSDEVAFFLYIKKTSVVYTVLLINTVVTKI